MGKALIISEQGEGLYTVKKSVTGLDAELTKLAKRRLILEVDLIVNRNTLGQIWRQVAMQRDAVNALMEQWMNGDIDPGREDDDPLDPDTDDPVITGNYISQAITLTNAARGGGLISNALLAQAAQGHANYMASQNGISHTGSGGSTPGDRIRRAGYSYSICGENVAAGQSSPQAVVDAWMTSPPHRANILDDRFSEIGIGLSVVATSVHRYYWCQCFGSPL